MGGRWNHNIHLHRVVLDAVPDGARRALDVGCGEGLLAQELRTDLVRPGGTLAVVGLARSRFPRDLPWELAGAVSTRVHKLTKTYWEHSSPVVWPPPVTFAGMRAIVADELPGASFGRHVLWRWWCTWTRPT